MRSQISLWNCIRGRVRKRAQVPRPLAALQQHRCLLMDSGPDGTWATETVGDAGIAAPDLAAYETANIIRRHELAGLVDSSAASQAHLDLQALAIDWWPYEMLGRRAWELRGNLSIYDGSYVALAELTRAPLCTLDRKINKAPGLRCEVRLP
jgi:predicted nucleic acid-binding protein